MLDKQIVKQIVEDTIKDTDLYIVELGVSVTNVINVEIDSMQGVSLDRCVEISKAIESKFDREEEDFELMVASAGIGQNFKVIQQYHKNVGRDVELFSTNSKKITGKLIEVIEEEGIKIEIEEKVKLEGKKRKELVKREIELKFDEIRSIKDIVTFK